VVLTGVDLTWPQNILAHQDFSKPLSLCSSELKFRHGICFQRKWQNGFDNLQTIWKQWAWLLFLLSQKYSDYNMLAVKYDSCRNKISTRM